MRSKRAFYTVVSNIILQLVILANGFIVPKIVINNYGSDVNGLIASITQFLGYITLLDSGFTAVIKSQLYKPLADKSKENISRIIKSSNKFFRTIAFVFIVYIVALSFLYPLLVDSSFDYLFTFGLVIILSISMLSEYYFGMTYKILLQADQKSYIVSLIQIIVYIISIAAIVILSKMNVSVTVLKLVTSVIFVIRPLLQNFYVRKHYRIDINIDGNYKIKNRWDGLAQHIASVIHSNTDIVVLTIFTNLKEVSVYSVYYLVVKGIKSIMQAFTNGFDATFGDMIVRNEREGLNRRFSAYETLYNTISVIAFSAAIVLITPFISVYTSGVEDADYCRPLFGVLIVISEYIWVIRQPYNVLTKAAGHFKETRKGAWIECITNIVVSIILVRQFGIIGVAIGTIIAMLIRAIEFMYHSNKYILCRSCRESFIRVLVVVLETAAIVFVCNYLPFLEGINYTNWMLNAGMVLVVAISITMVVNFFVFRRDFKELLSFMSKIKKKKS